MEQPLTPVNEERVGEPYLCYDGSFILEILKPHPSRNASVMMRATYKHNHPLSKLGINHPQTPPLHIHFYQVETFQILSGSLYTFTGYEKTLIRRTPENTMGGVEIPTMLPHGFHVDPEATEDTVALVWCHPRDSASPMDSVFFVTLFLYTSDVFEKKAKMDLLQIMLLQHQNESPLVMMPSAWWLGPIRYLLPYYMQVAAANLALLLGYKSRMPQYVSDAEVRLLEKMGKSE